VAGYNEQSLGAGKLRRRRPRGRPRNLQCHRFISEPTADNRPAQLPEVQNEEVARYVHDQEDVADSVSDHDLQVPTENDKDEVQLSYLFQVLKQSHLSYFMTIQIS